MELCGQITPEKRWLTLAKRSSRALIQIYYEDELYSVPHIVVRQEVPDAPEFLHLVRQTERDSQKIIDSRKVRTYQAIVLAEMGNSLVNRVIELQQDKIRLRITCRRRSCFSLIAEFLAVIRRALGG